MPECSRAQHRNGSRTKHTRATGSVHGSVEFDVRRSELGVRRLLVTFAGYGCFLLSNFTTTTIM